MTLRAYQQHLADCVARATLAHRRLLAVMPTGAGKTTLAGELARRMFAKGFRAWFVAHRIELVEQAAARFRKMGLSVGILAAGHPYNPTADVQVVMVQSLANRLASITPEQQPQYIFVDEAHHATADQYQGVFAAFPLAKIIGLTATPERADGTGMGGTFDVLLDVVSVLGLIEQGYLVRPLYYAAEADLSGLHTRGGDYQAAEVFERVNKPKLYAQVVEKYQLHGRGAKAIAFCVNVPHSKATAEAYCAAGIPAIHLDAETPGPERKVILADFAAGKYRVLCNVALFTEGFDLPEIGCVILNRPTKSRPLYHQMVGRGARPTAGFDEPTDEARRAAIAASSKPRFVVIDMGGNLKAHGFWEQPITYSLDAPKKAKRKGAALDVSGIKECPICETYAPPQARVCVNEKCGATFPSLLDRAQAAEFAAVEFGAPSALVAAVKADKSLKWPEDLRWAFHKPAKLSDADLARVEKHAGYKKGWAAGVCKRRGVYRQMGGGRQ